ncbi:MAG: YraN family protein [Ruminococcus sp.]|nr:YraN family protein [Ruminococcus sp.]
MGIFTHITKGQIGEDYIAKFLRRNKYKIIERNMRNKYSEIDIIAENKEYIIFVEVKTRTGESVPRPADAVNLRKQQMILRAAKYYLTYTNQTTKQPRFDVAEVFLSVDTNKPYKINYIENAFIQGGNYAVF